MEVLGDFDFAEKLYDCFKSKEWYIIIDSYLMDDLPDKMIEIGNKFFNKKDGNSHGFLICNGTFGSVYLLKKSMITETEFIKHTQGLLSDMKGKDVILPRPEWFDFEGYTQHEADMLLKIQTVAEARGDKKTGNNT